MEIMTKYEESSCMAPYIPSPNPSPNPSSNIETNEVNDWIRNVLQCNNNVLDIVKPVPTSTLINSLSPLNSSNQSIQNIIACSEEQILEQSRLKFFETLEYNFDRHSVGGRINFLPSKFFNQAILDAQAQSAQRCKKLSQDSQNDDSITARLESRLLNFIRVAKAKIVTENNNNCLRYLERNKKDEIQKFCEDLKESFEFLYQMNIDKATHELDFYSSTEMDTILKSMVTQVVQSWNKTIRIAMPDMEERPGCYDDDVEKALNEYVNKILTDNKKRNDNIIHEILEKGFEACKNNIEKLVTTAKFLDEITLDYINKHVTSYREQFLKRINEIVMENDSCSSNISQLNCKLQEKEKELVNYGQNFLKKELDKERKVFHSESLNEMKDLLARRKNNYRLKHDCEIYEEYVLKALEDAKRHCDSNGSRTIISDTDSSVVQDPVKCRPCPKSVKDSLRPTSSATSDLQLKPTRDINESPADVHNNYDSDESDVTVVSQYPPQLRCPKTRRSLREKEKSKKLKT